MPVPPLYFRNVYDDDEAEVFHEVIDGQQRIQAVLDFIEDEYALTKAAPQGTGKKFSDLSTEQQKLIRKYTFSPYIPRNEHEYFGPI